MPRPTLSQSSSEKARFPPATPRSGFVQQIAASNAGEALSFRCAAHVSWPSVNLVDLCVTAASGA